MSLLNFTEDAEWEFIWPIIQKDNSLSKELLMSLINTYNFIILTKKEDFLNKITCDDIAKLYILLCKNFTKKQADVSRDTKKSISQFKSHILKYLEVKSAVKQLQFIKEKLSNNDIIDFYLVEARKNKRESNWYPFSPDEFSILIKEANTYFVYNEELLIEAIINGLQKLEHQYLQGENPLAFLLWNECSNKYRPKSENDLSDFLRVNLKKELDPRGIIALREVEIRRRKGKEGLKGERTDIYITGFIPKLEKQLKVIIEVKGCWHPEVNKAMETQLVNRYLNKKDCNYGLYIVGWFDCNQWDKEDSRSNKLPSKDIEEVRQIFDNQAESLSMDDKLIKSYILDCSLK